MKQGLLDDLILLDFSKAVKACADDSKMFSINIDGIQCSFGNKRVWKTQGAAKTALTNSVRDCIWLSEYWNECITEESTSLLATFDWAKVVELKKKHKYYSEYKEDGEYAKEISKHLLSTKKVVISQIN